MYQALKAIINSTRAFTKIAYRFIAESYKSTVEYYPIQLGEIIIAAVLYEIAHAESIVENFHYEELEACITNLLWDLNDQTKTTIL